MTFSSHLLENAVNEFSKLPGIGKKTALRLVLHLLKQAPEQSILLSDSIHKLRNEIKFCKLCNNIADTDICNICNDSFRKKNIICVVESIRDVMAIESTMQYNGMYHVLGGLLSPIEGIGPSQLYIDSLIERIKEESIEELIMALSPNIEGDTTTYYITKKLVELPVKITTLSRGVAFGGELEYADEITLARSIVHRVPVESLSSGN